MLNGVCSDIYTLHINIQQELERLLQENLILKIWNSQSKLEIFTEFERRGRVFGYESKVKYPVYMSRNTFKRHVDLLLMGDEERRDYVFIKDFSALTDFTTSWNKFVICLYIIIC